MTKRGPGFVIVWQRSLTSLSCLLTCQKFQLALQEKQEHNINQAIIYSKARINHENNGHGLVVAPVPAAEPVTTDLIDHTKFGPSLVLDFYFQTFWMQWGLGNGL